MKLTNYICIGLLISIKLFVAVSLSAQDSIQKEDSLYSAIVEDQAYEEENNELNNNVVVKKEHINNSSQYRALIDDQADLFSEEEEDLLLKQMMSLTSIGHIAVVTILENEYYSSESYSRDYYEDVFGRWENGSLFLIDMDNRYIYIYSPGTKNYEYLSPTHCQVITGHAYRYATNKEYYQCASKALSEMEIILNGGHVVMEMVYISNAILALLIALFIAYLCVKISSPYKLTLDEYVKDLSRELDVELTDTPTVGVTFTRETKVSRSSSSGGRGGGRGGGSRGGGGGHRF